MWVAFNFWSTHRHRSFYDTHTSSRLWPNVACKQTSSNATHRRTGRSPQRGTLTTTITWWMTVWIVAVTKTWVSWAAPRVAQFIIEILISVKWLQLMTIIVRSKMTTTMVKCGNPMMNKLLGKINTPIYSTRFLLTFFIIEKLSSFEPVVNTSNSTDNLDRKIRSNREWSHSVSNCDEPHIISRLESELSCKTYWKSK